MAERIVFEGELDLEHLNLIKALSAREMYVEELAQIAERDERIVITGADVGASSRKNILTASSTPASPRPIRSVCPPVWPSTARSSIWQASARSSRCARSIRCIPT